MEERAWVATHQTKPLLGRRCQRTSPLRLARGVAGLCGAAAAAVDGLHQRRGGELPAGVQLQHEAHAEVVVLAAPPEVVCAAARRVGVSQQQQAPSQPLRALEQGESAAAGTLTALASS
jgi:hypothetical protein